MRSITIEAKTLESAQGLYEALSEFNPILTDGFRVIVTFGNLDPQVLAALNAVEQHVLERKTPAQLEMDGRHYTLQPD